MYWKSLYSPLAPISTPLPTGRRRCREVNFASVP